MNGDEDGSGGWITTTRLVTAVAGLLAAAGGLIGGLYAAGIIGPKGPPSQGTPQPPACAAIAVPDVRGLSLNSAEQALGNARLLFIEQDEDHVEAPGTVFAESPAQGSKACPGETEITLSVSNGLAIPNVVGEGPDQGDAAFSGAGFTNYFFVVGGH